ncbi:MAG TPA: Na+/H+ antiporter NhaA, partial [Ktedonobacterales bacterium]
HSLAQPVTLGVIAGLVVGKPVGILLGAWLATSVRVAALPEGIGWRHMIGVAFLGGIGFTMSLFITDLAFEAGSLVTHAKVGILLGSLLAGTAGWLLLRGAPRTNTARNR